MGSVQFQIVPCSSLYFFLKVYRPLPMYSMLTTGFNMLHLSLPKRFPFLYFGFLCLQVCSGSNFHPDTRVVIYLGSPVQSCCGEVGMLQTSITGMRGECWQCLDHTGFAPTLGVCAFPVYTAQAPGCSAGELSKAGPGLHALPRSKSLRFRFSGTPQSRRLGWACVLCPSQVRAAQVPGCLVSALSPGGRCILSSPRAQLLGFLGALQEHCLRCAPCLLWGADL